MGTSTKVSNLTAKNETLETLNKQHEATIASLKSKLEQQITKASKTETEFELEKSRFLKEIDSKQELIELTNFKLNKGPPELNNWNHIVKKSSNPCLKLSLLETALSEKMKIIRNTRKIKEN